MTSVEWVQCPASSSLFTSSSSSSSISGQSSKCPCALCLLLQLCQPHACTNSNPSLHHHLLYNPPHCLIRSLSMRGHMMPMLVRIMSFVVQSDRIFVAHQNSRKYERGFFLLNFRMSPESGPKWVLAATLSALCSPQRSGA